MNALDMKHINADLLPGSLQELAEDIGLDATLKLAEAYPSIPFYIPAKAEENHPIAGLIGMQAFEDLVRIYSGDTIKLAKVDAAQRQIKHCMLKRLKKEGASNRQVAILFQYSLRHVERLVSDQRHEEQHDLFDTSEN